MTLTIGALLPDVMGTYGDGGNAAIIYRRAVLRGWDARIIPISIFDPVPQSLDIYIIGGAEDFAQQLAVKHLQRYPGLQRAVEKGALVLAICAGLQILGNTWKTHTGTTHYGLGIVDIDTFPMKHRAIGETITTPTHHAHEWGITEEITGFENHRGGSILGAHALPLATCTHGVGNAYFDDQPVDRCEGVMQGSVLGTYLHGPLLARNPHIADALLTQATGQLCEPLEFTDQLIMRKQRLAAGKKRSTNPALALKPRKV